MLHSFFIGILKNLVLSGISLTCTFQRHRHLQTKSIRATKNCIKLLEIMATLRNRVRRLEPQRGVDVAELKYLAHNTAALLFYGALSQCILVLSATLDELSFLFSQ